MLHAAEGILILGLISTCGAHVHSRLAQEDSRMHLKLELAPDVDAPDVFPVPTATKCIVIMCCQYMIIYTALAVCRTYQEFAGIAKGKVEDGLKAAAQTLTYGPMLCVLFIACRMRVEFLSNGQDQPQLWVQHCMYGVTFAVLASSLLVLFVPLVTGKPMPIKDGSSDIERPTMLEDDSKIFFYTLTTIRYIVLFGLYGGLVGIIVGINTYLPPGYTDLAQLPPPAPAVMCTMILAVVFFTTQIVIAFCRTYEEFTGQALPKVVGLMSACATTVEFAPMLSILFLAARMRALQHNSQPQAWAQQCMYAATGSLLITTLLSIAVPLVLGGHMEVRAENGQATFVVPTESKTIGYALLALRCISMLGFYGGACGVIYSIFVFEAPGGPAHTLPVSPAVHCVVNLTCQFFFVYLMMTVMLIIAEVSGGRFPLDQYRFFSAIESAKATLAFAPMLSILFVTTRMYALLITNKQGAPQAWVQDGMYMSTWSLLISFVFVLIAGLFMDEVEMDDEGNVINKFSNRFVAIFVTAIRYMCMLLLYGGIVLVIVGIFTMTPENANGRGSVPVVSDAVNSTPVGEKPPGPKEAVKAGADAAGP